MVPAANAQGVAGYAFSSYASAQALTTTGIAALANHITRL
jgi:hypothetical protein